jgi:hypothetical protein
VQMKSLPTLSDGSAGGLEDGEWFGVVVSSCRRLCEPGMFVVLRLTDCLAALLLSYDTACYSRVPSFW